MRGSLVPGFGADALGRIPAERTRDRQLAIDIVRRRFVDHALHPSGAGGLRLTFRSAQFSDLGLHFVDYETPVGIRADELRHQYLVCFPTRGSATLRVEGAEWHGDRSVAMVLPPTRRFELDWHDASPRVILAVPRFVVEQVGDDMHSGDRQVRALQTTIDLATSAGRALGASMLTLHEDVNAGTARAMSDSMRRALAHGLVARLIAAATADDDDAPTMRSGRNGKLVAALLELAEATAGDGLAASAAAARLGVPLRTLQAHAKRELGMSPGEVLTRSRLQLARRRLQAADPTVTTVADVATGCGFGHFGRFAQAYRRAFGELPSETLAGGER